MGQCIHDGQAGLESIKNLNGVESYRVFSLMI